MECTGDEQGYVSPNGIVTIDQCADKCKGVSELFAYGTNDYGTDRCSGGSCNCLCETAAKDGSCKITSHEGYRLYIYAGKGNLALLQYRNQIKSF